MQCIDSESTFVASACECGVAVRNDTWHLPVKKASTAGIVGARRRRVAPAMEAKAEPRKAPSKRKCRKKENIKRPYLQDSKMMSARKITARTHVTTGISFAFLPAHFAIT